MEFQSYYKMAAPQTALENCVAHNGSLIPVPGRTIMAQSWYQGGISLLDWTDPSNPVEIAFHDRGPSDATRMGSGGSWSVYWYNGFLYSSEISRGLDVFEVTASAVMTQNELDAANSVRFEQLNSQGQPARTSSLNALASQIRGAADESRDPAKVRILAEAVRGLMTVE